MSPEKARVFVVEDSPDWQDHVKSILEKAGHSVILTAVTREEALAAVENLVELGVDVAAIDGNLNQTDTDGRDGQAVLSAIHARTPHIKTVGISSLSVTGTNANSTKRNMDNLGEIVRNL